MSLKTKCANLYTLHKEVMRRLQQRSKVASALVEERIPIVVDNLIARHIIGSETKQAMVESFRDHAKCLQFIDNLAQNTRSGTFGKAAKYTDAPSSDERESDRVFKEMVLRKRTSIF